MMKRITALGVLIVMTLSFSGCGVKYNAVVVDSGLTFREEFLQENKNFKQKEINSSDNIRTIPIDMDGFFISKLQKVE